tara:strand:- start:58 stop:201 length:144 start_codon:yes stop_codon:yes gene_type:complete
MNNDKTSWEEPTIKPLGDLVELTKGGEGGDPKFLGLGDQFAVNDLTT